MMSPMAPARYLQWLLGSGRLPEVDDGNLLTRFLACGDEQAFAELVHRHGPMVLGVCRRRLDDPEEVEDAFQATFLILVARARSLRDDSRVGAWLHAVAIRVAARARGRRLRRELLERGDSRAEPAAAMERDTLVIRELRGTLDTEIRRLPDRERRVVILCWLEGATHEQAAILLGWPIGTVKSRLAAARERLRGRLARRGMAPGLVVAALAVAARPARAHVSGQLMAGTLALARPLGGGVSAVGLPASTLAREVSGELRRTATGRIAGLALSLSLGLAVGPLFVPSSPPAAAEPPARQEETPRPPRNRPTVDRLGDPLPDEASGRIGSIRHRQSDRISRLSFTPDGRSLVTDVGERLLQVWDVPAGRPTRTMDPGLEAMRDFALSPDGKTVAAVGFSYVPDRRLVLQQLVFVDLASGRVASRREWSGRGGEALAYSTDGRSVATNSEDGILRIWDPTKSEPVLQLKVGERSFRGLASSPVGKLLAVATFGNGGEPYAVQIVDIAAGKIQRSIDRLKADVSSLAFSPDGKLLAVAASNEGEFGLWDVSTGKALRRMNVKAQSVRNLAFRPDGKTLAVVSDFGELSFWDVDSARKVRTVERPRTVVSGIAFSPDGKLLAVNGGDTVLHLHDVEGGRDLLEVPDAHQAEVHALTFSPDGKVLVTAGDDGIARAWNPQSQRPISPVLRHESWVRSVALSGDGRRLVTGSNWPDGKVRMWGLRTGTLLREWPAPAGNLRYPIAVAFGPRDASVLACWNSGRLSRWDAETGDEAEISQPAFPQARGGPGDDLAPLGAFSPRGDAVAVLPHHAGGILLADLATGRLRFESRALQSLAFSPDGKLLGVGRKGPSVEVPLADGTSRSDGSEADGLVTLLDAETGRERRTLVIPRAWLSGIAISPDNRFVAASTYFEAGQRNGGVHIFRLADGTEVRKIPLPSACTQALAFTPDGQRLVGGLRDTSVLIWDVAQAH